MSRQWEYRQDLPSGENRSGQQTPGVTVVQVGHGAPGGYAIPPGIRLGGGHRMGRKPRTDSGTQKQKPSEERPEKKVLGKLADDDLSDMNQSLSLLFSVAPGLA